MREFINESQTQEFRRFKYYQLRTAGFTKKEAAEMRDWKLNAVMAEIAKATVQSIKQTSFGFHRELKDAGIEKEKTQ